MRYFLVYQAGIANVFKWRSDEDHYERLLQHAFSACEYYCRGLIEAGATVEVWSCNKAGDISEMTWTKGLADCPFRDAARPPSNALFVSYAGV